MSSVGNDSGSIIGDVVNRINLFVVFSNGSV